MTIRFHSPLPPARTGVADYSAALMAALRPRAEIVPNPSGNGPGVDLYHMGNNALHRPVYERALARPGVIVLHDAVLQHFYLGLMEERVYVAEFVHNYGEWNRGLGQKLWTDRARAAHDERYFAWPMLRRMTEAARGVIVHNPAAAGAVRRHIRRTGTDYAVPDEPTAGTRSNPEVDRAVRPHSRFPVIHEIPHLFAEPYLPHAASVESLRRELGLGAGAFLFALLGHLRETKRVMPVLKLISRIRRTHPEAHLLVAGQFGSSDLARAAATLLNEPGVIRRGYLSSDDFWLYASACDAVINLRYPSAGEASGIGIRLMGIGKPCFMTSGDEIAQFPAGCMFPVDPGVEEESQLAAGMLWMLDQPLQARQMGLAAQRHIITHHNPEEVARLYLSMLATANG